MIQRLIYIIFILIAFSSAEAQVYSNDWINHSQEYHKIQVTEDGIYKIPYSTLSASIPTLNSINGDQFTLYRNGKQVKIYVTTNSTLSSSDYIEFYGRKNDGAFDEELFPEKNWHSNPFTSLITDTSSYYLTWNNLSSNPRIGAFINDLNNLPPKEKYVWNRVVKNYDTRFLQGTPYATFSSNLYNSVFEAGEGLFDADYTSSKTYTVNTPNIASNGASVSYINTLVAAWSTGDHHMNIDLNGLLIYDTAFSGYKVQKVKQTTATINLQASNTLKFSALAPGTDRNAVSYIEVIYPRNLNMLNASEHYFSLDGDPSNRKYLEINNFNDNGQQIILYDLTNGLRITSTHTPGNSPIPMALPISFDSRECYIRADDNSEVNIVSTLKQVDFIDFGSPQNQGNYIIVSHRDLFNDGLGNNWVEEYRKYRDQNENPDAIYDAITIDVNDLYEQFAYGHKKHPLAIRKFAEYAVDIWTTQPEFLFLIGKGSLYNEMRVSQTFYDQCLIPTFGNPASDNLLTADHSNTTPKIPTGRLAARTANEVRIYLDKIQEYENVQQSVGDFYQTVDEKFWMKKILHFGGGTSAAEQALLKSYLNSYKGRLEKIYTGASIDSFYKKSTSPIANVQSDYLKDLITNGVSMITFFGHSSPGSFDISIDEPENYTNFGKYPLIYSNGCFAGYIFGSTPGISERFVINENKGAIAFLSTTGLSISISLDVFAKKFIKNMSKDLYGRPLGEIIQSTIAEINATNQDIYTELVTHEMTLHGDPALKLNFYEDPDYAIEPNHVRFEPRVVSAVLDSFDIIMDIHNLGKAVKDSFDIRLIRNKEDGTQLNYTKRIEAPLYKSTVRFRLPTITGQQNGDEASNSIETFSISIDASDEVIGELSEMNNSIPNSYFPEEISLNIIAEDVFPVSPYNYGITGSKNIILKSSTSNPFSNSRWYIMQLDTSKLFNSSFKTEARVFHPGGVIEWNVNLLDYDSTVYYWRVAKDSSDPSAINWHESSFVYIPGSTGGWNQSHYYQFEENAYSNIYIDSLDRNFHYVDDVKEIDVTTGVGNGIGGNLADDDLGWLLNGVKMHRWRMGGCGGLNGLTFAVIDENSGLPWSSINQGGSDFGPYGNFHCSFQYFEQFGFNFNTTGTHPDLGIPWSQVISNFIDSIPSGSYILMYSHNMPPYTSWDNSLVNKLLGIGAMSVLPLSKGGFAAAPYIFFTQKGNSSYPHVEKLGSSYSTPISENIVFTGSWKEGFFRSDRIGPAKNWDRLLYKSTSVETGNTDNISIDIYGVPKSNDNSEILLSRIKNATDTTLSFIDAATYPYLRLQFNALDDINRTPSQLQYWRVMFEEAPDIAINPAVKYLFDNDTLQLGESLAIKIGAQNISNLDIDPVLVKFSHLDASQSFDTSFVRYQGLSANDTLHLTYKLETYNEGIGDNILTIEMNPDNDQVEKYHFNNIGILNYKVFGDNTNPLLDVTFDGEHILDGDIVSAKPFILITLKDDNSYLALDDTSVIEVELNYPDGSAKKIFHKSSIMDFIPADASGGGSNNSAKVELRPEFFEDGIYQLVVRDKDKSGNRSGGATPFKISFEIVTTAGISNVLNYPNPFTTSTQFVFTLTGSELPEYFKIQIMTVKGKVIKEITQSEIGNLHIGRNITDYTWDGTDQYGDPLGNGVYFYRVVTRMANEEIEHINTEADKYFKKGIGKMVLLR
ncbi:MAG: hypothetical protein HKN92_10750 [Chitinophagales bacterium]|nr:hypothetical protein [Chitinophagales bacterium]